MNCDLDSVEQLIKENKWLEKFFEGQGCCVICFHADPFDLELHHVGGKANSDFQVSLCRNCHGRISRKQYNWPKDWSKKGKNQKQKTSFLLRGFADILQEIAERMYYE